MSKPIQTPAAEPIQTTFAVIRTNASGAFKVLEVKTQGKKVISSTFHEPEDVLYIVMSKVEQLIEKQAKAS